MMTTEDLRRKIQSFRECHDDWDEYYATATILDPLFPTEKTIVKALELVAVPGYLPADTEVQVSGVGYIVFEWPDGSDRGSLEVDVS